MEKSRFIIVLIVVVAVLALMAGCTGNGSGNDGKSTTDFINSYRLRYATHLLSTTNDSIALIAELCGLSRRTFYRLFNEAFSMSPSDYRKVAKK